MLIAQSMNSQFTIKMSEREREINLFKEFSYRSKGTPSLNFNEIEIIKINLKEKKLNLHIICDIY